MYASAFPETGGYQLPNKIFDDAAFSEKLRSDPGKIGPLCRKAIADVTEELQKRFEVGTYVVELVEIRAQFFDQLLRAAWRSFFGIDSYSLALIAVGGYGRGELHPYSDIDLLILARDTTTIQAQAEQLEQFVTFLWDLRQEVGHSVRTLQECFDNAEKDLTVITTLIETRHIAGDAELLDQLNELIAPSQLWSSADFYAAKLEEQRLRHKKYANTEYNLEPNIKTSPGGLRDIHVINWIAKRHYGVDELSDLVPLGFLTSAELELIEQGQAYLWSVRYALHTLCKRHEDRLLFDHQRALAEQYGHRNDDRRLAVEKFMKVYYRWAAAIHDVSELIIQNFDEAIVRACEPEQVFEINQRFRIRNYYLEIANDRVFQQTPSAILEAFVILAQRPDLLGVRASTIRQLREAIDLIDDDFRDDSKNKELFLELLRSPHRITTQLRRMKRYGVLGAYIPAFGRIIGQMQHDLFHIYSVDAHTLQVVNNLRRFNYPEQQGTFPLACDIIKRINKKELLYIAGLFHDIGKGRGGDHSELGAVDAAEFCLAHGYSQHETNLVVWLVEKHLMMSSVAQRQDIADPEVIYNFASEVGDTLHLDYLYLLTVADMCGTNDTIWNSWRASLMRQLYTETRRALRRGLENVRDKHAWASAIADHVLVQLEARGMQPERARELLGDPGDDYFLREPIEDIVWQLEALNQHTDDAKPLVIINPTAQVASIEGATKIFVWTRDQRYLFAVITNALEQLNLSIQDARIYSSQSDHVVDTFIVLDADGSPIGADEARMEYIRATLDDRITNISKYHDIVRRRTPRQLKHFAAPTQVNITTDINGTATIMEVITPDRPGLLAVIGEIFTDYDVSLQNAKIATLGERVEDIFYITDDNGLPIADPSICRAIQAAICQRLDENANQDQ